MKIYPGFVLILIHLTFFLMGYSCVQDSKFTIMLGGAPNEIAFWNQVIQQYQEEYGIKLEIMRQSTDTDQRKQGIIFAMRGRIADPDIMLLDVAWIGQIAYSDWLLSLNEYTIPVEHFYPHIIQNVDTYQGRLLAIPFNVDGGMLYYRKDLIERYGYTNPPSTWKNLLEMALHIQGEEKKSNPDFWGFVWQGAQYEGLVCNALEVFTSAGGGFFSNVKTPIINHPENEKALQLMSDWINTYRISPPNTYTNMREEPVRMEFQNGNALFERNWPYAWSLHNQETSAIENKFGIAPLPHFPNYSSASTLGGWHIAVSKYTDKPDRSVDFIKYLSQYEVQKAFCQNLGWAMGRMDVYEDEELLNQLPHLLSLRDIFQNAVARPVIPYYSEISQVLQKYIHFALTGNKSPEEALELAHQEIQEIMKEYED